MYFVYKHFQKFQQDLNHKKYQNFLAFSLHLFARKQYF